MAHQKGQCVAKKRQAESEGKFAVFKRDTFQTKRPVKSGKLWSCQEITHLETGRASGMPFRAISNDIGRSEQACRLKVMNLKRAREAPEVEVNARLVAQLQIADPFRQQIAQLPFDQLAQEFGQGQIPQYGGNETHVSQTSMAGAQPNIVFMPAYSGPVVSSDHDNQVRRDSGGPEVKRLRRLLPSPPKEQSNPLDTLANAAQSVEQQYHQRDRGAESNHPAY